MSIHNILVPNRLHCYINDLDVSHDVTIEHDLTVLGTIHGNIPHGSITPGAPNQFLRTNNSGTQATWQNFTAADIPSGTNGQFLGTVGSSVQWTNLPSATISESSARCNVNPASNVDPVTNGLLIPAGSGQIDLPLTTGPIGIGLAEPYINDVDGDYTIGANTITINNNGDFCVSFNVAILGSVGKASPVVVQVIRNGDSIFTVPALIADAVTQASDIGPFGPWTKAWILSASANSKLVAGDQLVLALLPNNPTDDNCVQIISNISINRIDPLVNGIQGPQGQKGDKGDDGIQGQKGDKGDDGIQGQKGDQGIQGDKGEPGPNIPMLPTTIGSAYGFQDTGSLLNNFGYDNNSQLTRGNVIAQSVPTSLVGDKSNVIASVNTLQSTNNIIDSNVIISADTAEVGNVIRSNLLGQSFNNNSDYDHCLYIGDMTNTTPSNLSMCVNNNYYGNPISMAKEAVYFGMGRNNINLLNREFHIDTGCPDLYYHDLATGTSTNVLYYDNSNGKITYGSEANPTPINGQVASTTSPGTNNISNVSNDDGSAGVLVSNGPPLLQLFSNDQIQLNSGTGTYRILNVPNSVITNGLYISPVSGALSYGPVVSTVTSSAGAFNTLIDPASTSTGRLIKQIQAGTGIAITNNSTNLVVSTSGVSTVITSNILSAAVGPGTTADLQNLTIPANTITSTSQTYRYISYGSTTNAGVANSCTLLFQVGGTTVGTFPFTVTANGSYRVDGYLTVSAIGGGIATYQASGTFSYTDSIGSTNLASYGTIGSLITSTLSIKTRATTGVNTQITNFVSKCWLE